MGEKWKELYKTEDLKKLQGIELEMLKDFLKVCEKLKINGILYGGTLLGAVKYKGFIPWDDDVDLALLRDDYECFIKEADKYLDDKYVIQTPYNESKSPFPYAKMRLKGTKYMDYPVRNLPIESGIYIDIYPIDKIPDDEEKRQQQFNEVRKLMRLYVNRQRPTWDMEPNTIKGFLRKTAKWTLHKYAKLHSQQFFIEKIDRCMKRYNGEKTKRYAALNSPNYDNIYLNLLPLEKGIFEGVEVNLPGDYRTHLKMRYGNIDELPPEEERYGHEPYILDFGKYEKGNAYL